MPILSKEFKSGVQNIPLFELQKLVLKLARGNKDVYDVISIEYLQKEEARDELFEETKGKIQSHLFNMSARGSIQKSIAAAMSKAVKEINYYTKITHHKPGEAELLSFFID